VPLRTRVNIMSVVEYRPFIYQPFQSRMVVRPKTLQILVSKLIDDESLLPASAAGFASGLRDCKHNSNKTLKRRVMYVRLSCHDALRHPKRAS